MILKDNLYIITNEDIGNGLFKIRLKADCFIFTAHFPHLPITPGVCLVQMVKELAEIMIGKTLTLTTIKNAKFLIAVQPNDTEYCINIKIKKQEGNICSFQSIISDIEDNTYAKISLQTAIEK